MQDDMSMKILLSFIDVDCSVCVCVRACVRARARVRVCGVKCRLN